MNNETQAAAETNAQENGAAGTNNKDQQ